jgi:hypothetical protein
MNAPNDGVQFERGSLLRRESVLASRVDRGNVRRGYNAPCRANARPTRYPFLRSEALPALLSGMEFSVPQTFFDRDIERIDDLFARRAFKVRLTSLSFRPRSERTSMRATGD